MTARWCPRCQTPETGPCPRVRRATDAQRGTSAARGYDSKWRRFRDAVLHMDPICHDCEAEGHIRMGSQVHHIHKLADGGARFDPANCMTLCHRHHSIRTARGE